MYLMHIINIKKCHFCRQNLDILQKINLYAMVLLTIISSYFMKKNKLSTLLQQIGLSEKESEVYLALLTTGPSRITTIASIAGVKRTTVYSILESLIERGLAREEEKGFKKYVVAESPERVGALLDQWRDNFFQRLPEFQALQRFGEDKKDSIKYYRGLPAIKNMYADIFKSLSRKDTYLVISDTRKWIEIDSVLMNKIARQRADMELNVRIITTNSPEAKHYQKFERNFSSKMRILPPDVSYNASLTITPNAVIIMEFAPLPSAIVINHSAVISLGTTLFEIIWKTTHPMDKTER